MTEPKAKPDLRPPEEGRPITREEILEVMADEDYSADARKEWVKEVLTRLAKPGEDDSDPDMEKLEAEIRETLQRQATDDTDADDKT